MKKILLGLIGYLIFSSALWSSEALLLTDLGTSAQMIALGNIEGYSRSACAIFENPAGLYKIKKFSMAAFTTRLFSEVSFRNVALAWATPIGTIGAGYMSADVSDIPSTYLDTSKQQQFQVDHYFRYDNILAKLAYQGTPFKFFHAGGSLNYYTSRMDQYKSAGWSIDLGGLFDFQPFQLSVILKNAIPLTKITYTNDADSDYKGEETQQFNTNWTLIYHWADFNFLGQYKTVSHHANPLRAYGIHYTPSFIPLISVYGGYKEYYQYIVDVANIYTVGIGLNLFALQFHYAYEKSDHYEFDNNNYFSFCWTI